MNPIQIYFNNGLIDTIITGTRWIQYISAINVISLGNQPLLLQGSNQIDIDGVIIDADTAIANILFSQVFHMPHL